MAYSYKCSISFGLVYIPVTLHASVKTQDVGFNMLDKKTMSRVKYKKTCEECDGREVKQEDIVKGYEYEDDKEKFLYIHFPYTFRRYPPKIRTFPLFSVQNRPIEKPSDKSPRAENFIQTDS